VPAGPGVHEAARARDASVRFEPLAPEHVAAVEALALDPDVRCRTPARLRPPAGFARSWVSALEPGDGDPTRDGFAIVASADKSFLGVAAAVCRDELTSEAEVVLLLAGEARRDGLAGDALALVTKWGFARGLHRLELRVCSEDVALHRAAAGCGYVREGLLRSAHVSGGRRSDVVLYSRLPGDD
jgi:RimJ/RimL family protein N-acetyltransferase